MVFGFDVAKVGEIPKTIILSERLSFRDIDMSSIMPLVTPAVSIAMLNMLESLLAGHPLRGLRVQD